MNEKTIERKIFAQGEKYKILTTQQDSGNWMATVLFENNNVIETHHVTASSENDAHEKAIDWAMTKLD